MERNGRRIATRSRALVAKDVGDEVVVYDLDTDKVHLLDARASVVWRLAKEPIALDDLVEQATRVAPDEPWREEILAVVDELAGHGLLDESPGPPLLDRRRLLKLAGAAALAAPAITTILAPPAAATHSSGNATLRGQTCPGGVGDHCTSGVCGTDGLCGACIATNNQTTACTGVSTDNVVDRCCSGNACTTVGTTGDRCCQPNGVAPGTGVCCGTNNAGVCGFTPAGTIPGVVDVAMCQTYTNRTISVSGANRCCIASGGGSVADLGATSCCSGSLATPTTTILADGSSAKTLTITSAAVGAIVSGTRLVISWVADSLGSTTYPALAATPVTVASGGSVTVVSSSTMGSVGAGGGAGQGLTGGYILATAGAGFTASSTITVNLSAAPDIGLIQVRSVSNAVFDDHVAGTPGQNTGTAASASVTPTGTGDLVIAWAANEANVAYTALTGVWGSADTTFTTGGGAAGNLSMISQPNTSTTAGSVVTYGPANPNNSEWIAVAISLKRTCT